jgi:type III secretion protein C
VTHKIWLKPLATFALAVSMLVHALPSMAASLSGARKPFVYNAQSLPLADLLRDFASAQGLPMMLGEGVTGTVNATFNLPPEGFLDTISRAFGLIWYFDGTGLYIYPADQMQSRLFKLKGVTESQLNERLAAFRLSDSRFPLRMQPGSGLVLAIGPPRHIELLDAMVAALTETQAQAEVEAASPAELRVFQLVYASAVDRSVQATTVPGMASLLTQVFGGPGQGTVQQPPSLTGVEPLLDNIQQQTALGEQRLQAANGVLRGPARAALGGSPTTAAPSSPRTSRVFSPQSTARAEPRKPVPPTSPLSFAADEATNSVIVRGPADRMVDVERLIAKLDVPSEMVEIEATIIDIAADEVASLGFDWQYQSSGASIQVSPTGAGSSVGATASQAGGFNITTLVSGAGLALLARVRAIEAKGTGRIVSQPKVLGAANRTALLSDKRTASVRVAGNQDAQLFSVEAGTTLQMTPRVIRDPGSARIGLDLFIEDGGFSSQLVDQVPVVQRTTIRTEATLMEGQSLLIGGIVVESTNSSRSGVPGLSRLPFIGGLFRVDETSANRRQRMFLITPKRVSTSSVQIAAREVESELPTRSVQLVPAPSPAPAPGGVEGKLP